MISAVLDANTLVSAILVEQGSSRQILRAAYERQFACVSGVPIVTEVLRTFARPRVYRKYQIRPDDIERLHQFLTSNLVAVTVTVEIHGVATHPEDERILATAVSAQAEYLVTGDRGLLNLRTFQGVRIVTPRQFLAILTDARDDEA